jgi:hypothetical protein
MPARYRPQRDILDRQGACAKLASTTLIRTEAFLVMSEEPTKRRFGGKDIAIGVGALLVLLLLLWLLFQPKPARSLIFGELGGLLPKSTNAVTNITESLPPANNTTGTPLPTARIPDITGSQRMPEGVSQPTQEVMVAGGGGTTGINSGTSAVPIPGGGSQDTGQPGGPANVTTQLSPGSASTVPSAPQPGLASPTPNAPEDVARQSTEDLLQTTGSGRRPAYAAGTAPGTQPGGASQPASTPSGPAATPPPPNQSAATPNANSPASPASSTSGLDASSTQPGTPPAPSPDNPNTAPPPSGSSQASTPSSGQPGADSAPNVATTPMPDGVAKESTEDLLQAVNKSSSSADQSSAANSSQTKAANAPTQTAASGSGSTSPTGQAANGSTGSAPDLGATGGGGLASGGNAARLPETDPKTLFDPQQSGTNVVFVLDRSLSMMGEKSLAARRELVKTLHRLGANTSFYILLFPYMAMPAPGPLPATRDNVDSMGGWLFSVGHRMGSDPVKAMTRALQFNPTTVWLLSDGKFSPAAAKAIRSANDPVNATIQTIGFYSREGEAVLSQIASENHGTYRFVPPPNQTATNSVTY